MSQLDVVTAIRRDYPTPLGERHAAFLLEVATTLGKGAGLFKKDYGTFITLPDGTKVSQDIICYTNGEGYDCLVGAEEQAAPAWQGPIQLPDIATRYYKVAPGVPVPPDPPAVQYMTRAECMAALASQAAEFTGRLNVLEARLDKDIQDVNLELQRPLIVEGNTDSAGPSFLKHYHGSTPLKVRRG